MQKMQRQFNRTLKFIKRNSLNKTMLKDFDWPLFILVILIALCGVVCIFAATASPIDDETMATMTMLEIIQTQPTEYAGLQLLWIVLGVLCMVFVLSIDYEFWERHSNTIYWLNIAMLTVVLFMESQRGGMSGWFQWGSNMQRTIQPSEFAKLAIIISLARTFARREKPITTLAELIPMLAYVGLPFLLIILQPDYGTAMVFIVIFGVMLFSSGVSYKLLVGIAATALLMLVAIWYMMNNAEDNFRLNRILVFLDPTLDPTGSGMQSANARIAVGSGGLWGKGMFSSGSFASLNYIPDDHTDFIFAIVCEAFGFVGAGAIVLALLIILLRMVVMSYQAADKFGRYVIIGIVGMMLFHIVENVGMVIGILPVTGIPLPFISYGGSNLMTNMIGMGFVFSINMRSKSKKKAPKKVAKL
ncbi:MAG: rod shape-determining protein RodA [Clostridia bacterium]|nr:rod shape-determining protein RodA [Clostridia bacterium]